MRGKLDVPKSVNFTQEMADKIQQTADTLHVPFQEIIRECVEIELPKLIERERKRTKHGQFSDKRAKNIEQH